MRNNPPKYVVFEGISGSGKTTQMNLLYEYLTSCGQACLTIHEPSPLYTKLRKLVSPELLSDTLDTLLYLIDRHASVDPRIRRALASGKTVLADRSYLSTLVYQGGKGWSSVANLIQLHSVVVQPSHIIILDAPANTAMTRIVMRHKLKGALIGRHETSPKLAHDRLRFKGLIALFPRAVVIKTRGLSASAIHQKVTQALDLDHA